jgi:hypothetical protein
VALRLLSRVRGEALRSRYRQQLLRVLRARWREPHILFIYVIKVAMHYHYAKLARALGQVDEATGAMPNAGRSFSRTKRPAEARAVA